MTFREKLKLEHPECVDLSYVGGCWECPHTYGYEPINYKPCRVEGCSKMSCTKCWDREIPEKKESLTMNMNDKYRLDDVEFYKEDNEWYMKLKYIIENDSEVAELHIPKVAFGFNTKAEPCITRTVLTDVIGRNKDEHLLTVGGNQFEIQRGNIHDVKSNLSCDGVFYVKRVIKEKTKKMTVAEIEKKLGYKIEIVSEDKK